MKKLVISAAALSLSPLAVANDSDWLALDEDIQALSASVQGLEGTGINIGGRVRAFYNISEDINAIGDPQTTGSGVPDLGGFSINNARLYAFGTTTQNIGYRIEVDFADRTGVFGDANLLDAYLDLPFGGEITARVGQFRAQVLRESLIDSGNLFFADRSLPALLFAGRSQGLSVMGNFDALQWAVTAQNGGDGLGDDLFYAIRAQLDLAGEGTDLIEGAYGASEEMEASIAAAYFDDGNASDADGVAIEGSLATSQFSAQAVLLVTGEDVGFGNSGNVDTNEFYGGGLTVLPSLSDATPWAIGGTFMLTQAGSDYGAWEVGARFQNLDDDQDTTILDVGVNYYADGHNMKYIFNWTNLDSDGPVDGDILRIGVQTRF